MNQQHHRSLQSVALICASVLLAPIATSCHRETPGTTNQTTSVETHTKGVPMRDVRTELVAVSRFRRSIETTGTVAFDQNRSTQVLSPISGPVARILVGTGSHVARDEALAIVASPDFAAAMSALRKAEATARNARRVAELDRQLFKNDAIARRDMEQAETDAVGAEADRDAALQQLRSLGVDQKTLDDIQQNRPVANPGGIIRSPLAGTVVEKLISPGQLLQAGTTPCFTVADLSSVWVIANGFEADLPFVKIGDPAEVLTGAGVAPLTGKVSYIAALVDPNTRAIAVRLDVPNPGEVLKRDLYVRVVIHSRAESQGLLVPVSAVLRDEESLPFVFVAKPDGTFARQSVQIGSRLGDHQEITSGLTAGQSIVVEGGLFLSAVEHS
jgi:cobalt-zinc-cadmium efflux system membrane fusion protein